MQTCLSPVAYGDTPSHFLSEMPQLGGMESLYKLCVRWIVTARLAEPATAPVVKKFKDRQAGCTKRTQSQSRGSGCPSRIAVRSAKSALLVYLQSNVPFSCAEEKYHRPCYGKQGKTCFSSKRKEEHSFSKGKRKGRSFCDVTKGTKSTEKGRRLPPSLFKPIPFDKWGQSHLSGMRKVSSSCKTDRKQRAIVLR